MRKCFGLLCAVMVLCILLSGCFSSMKIKDFAIENTAEIEAIYYENETLFQAAAEALISYETDDEFIRIFPAGTEHFEYTVPVWYYDLESVMIISSMSLSDEQGQKIQAVAAPLMKALDLPQIASLQSGVLFLLDAGTGQTAELHYLISGGEAHLGFGIRDKLHINENWYAVTTSD